MIEALSMAEVASLLGAATALWVAFAERKKRGAERDNILSEAAIKLVEPLKARISMLESDVECRSQTIMMLTKRIDYLESEVTTRDRVITSMSADLNAKKTQITAMQAELDNKTQVIGKLEREVHKLMQAMYCDDRTCTHIKTNDNKFED